MIGKRKPQTQLFDVGNVYPLPLKPRSFHSQLAQAAPRLFNDEDFAAFYSDRMGRPSVPPSLLALTLLLQGEARVSDEEAIERTAFDLRWAAVLSRTAGEPLCAKSTLQLFRAHLILHDEVRTLFQKSIREARRSGLLKDKALRVAIDTKPIIGRGAVLDTYNLLAASIRQAGAALAKEAKCKPDDWLRANGLGRYTESSIKGSAEIDWSDADARNRLLSEIAADARRLLSLASGAGEPAQKATELLQAILLQDIEPAGAGPDDPEARIKQGTAKDRVPSAADPEQRHGRKSKSHTFTGHKASVACDIDSQIILAVDVLPGDAGDATGALELVGQAQSNAELPVEETLADCAYGGSETRQAFAEAKRELIAKVPQEADRRIFPKSAFVLDLENHTVTCPEGKTASRYIPNKKGGKIFLFGSACRGCPLREHCTANPNGRTISVHPQEARLKEARAYQQSSQGKAHLRGRVVVEHRLARLGQLGIGQARYAGRRKTRFQLVLAATIANFRRVWNWQEGQNVPPAPANSPTIAMTVRIAIGTAFYALSHAIHLKPAAIRRTIQTAITQTGGA